MRAKTNIAVATAAGHRAMFHKWAVVDPRPMKPSRSSAKRPPTKARTRLTSTSAISTKVEATSIALRRRKLRPPSTSKTTLSARRAAPPAPALPPGRLQRPCRSVERDHDADRQRGRRGSLALQRATKRAVERLDHRGRGDLAQ